MTSPRRSARLSGLKLSPDVDRDVTSVGAGSKHKAQNTDESPKPKRSRNTKDKKEQTLKKSISVAEHEGAPKDTEMKEAAEGSRSRVSANERHVGPRKDSMVKEPAADGEATEEENAGAGVERTDMNGATNKPPVAADATDDKATAPETWPKRGKSPAIKKDPERKAQVPSNIIEKGIIYFFTRGRVNIENPQGVQDLQRTYFVLRPLPKDVKLGQGAIPESGKNRLAVLSKKVFPKSSKDRFLAFVEKGDVSMKVLKEEFFPGTEYESKTAGTRQIPPVSLLGEGVYAITAMGRTSYLTYILTIPHEIGQVQSDIGLRKKDSFIVSIKNPTKKGPTYTQLPKGPEYPKEMLEEFHDLRWVPVHKTEYLNYANTQFLLIGTGGDRLNKTLEPADREKEGDKETPEEELEKLEGEDQIRVEQMDGDAVIFEDLHMDKSKYPDVLTTW